MPYQSRLGAVFFQRKNNEELALQELAQQQNRLTIEQECLQSLEKKMQVTLEDLVVRQSEGGGAYELTLYFRFIMALQEKVDLQKKAIHHQEAVCEAKRVLLETAVKERKAVEEIEKKREAEYLKVQAKREQDELDEIGGQLKFRSFHVGLREQ
ncbi:MAG: flagellar export protein FliJ [Nitrospirota bacterium]